MLSIIIPTLNAGAILKATLASLVPLETNSVTHEIIVADGGSNDDTAIVASKGGAILLESVPGRGQQLSRGAAAATGEWLLFLHADTRPEPGWWDTIAAFTADPANNSTAAYFLFRLDDDSHAARLLEHIVQLRNSIFALPYGDQGLLIHRSHYERLGGYRKMPIMEDFDLIRRIGSRNLRSLEVAAITSAVKYRRDGYIIRSLINLLTLGLYVAGISPNYLNGLRR